MHTLNSWMLLRDGRPQIVGGTPGSFWQVQTNLQLISQLVDQGMALQAAVDAPRWTMGGPTSWSQAALSLEGRFGEETAAALRRYGHEVRQIGDWEAGGAAQLIRRSLQLPPTPCPTIFFGSTIASNVFSSM